MEWKQQIFNSGVSGVLHKHLQWPQAPVLLLLKCNIWFGQFERELIQQVFVHIAEGSAIHLSKKNALHFLAAWGRRWWTGHFLLQEFICLQNEIVTLYLKCIMGQIFLLENFSISNYFLELKSLVESCSDAGNRKTLACSPPGDVLQLCQNSVCAAAVLLLK